MIFQVMGSLQILVVQLPDGNGSPAMSFLLRVEGSEMVLPKMSGMVSTLVAQETPCQTLTCNARPNFR